MITSAPISPNRPAQNGALIRVPLAILRSGPAGFAPRARFRALAGMGRLFLALLRDESVNTIVVEHRDRFARFGAEYVEAALSAQGRRLLVADPSELDDDLVGDVTEILTSLCARLYGRRAAANRAKRAVEAVTGDTP